MKRLKKWLIVLIAVVAVAGLALSIGLPLLFDEESIKQQVTEQVSARTGRELNIDGPFKFSVFPSIGLEVNDLKLSNASGFGDAPFATVGQARVSVRLVPLLRRQLHADKIVLKGLRMSLAIRKDGTSNWADLGNASEPAAAKSSRSSSSFPFSSQRIDGLDLSDAELEFLDERAGVHYRLSHLTFRSGALGTSAPTPIELSVKHENLITRNQLNLSLKTLASINIDHGAVEMPDIRMIIDDSTLTGSLAVRSRDSAMPSLKFNLDIDTLDLDRYLLADTNTAAEKDGAPIAIPSQQLAGVDIDGIVRIGRLTASGITLTDAELGLRVEDRVLRTDPLKASLYGGSLTGDLVLNAGSATPKVSMDVALDSVQFSSLASDLLDFDQLSGSASGQIQAAGRGASSDALLRDLDGSLELRLDEGAFEGIDLWYQIRMALALANGEPGPLDNTGRTVFSQMNSTGTINNGSVNLRKLQAELPFLGISGQGSVDLVTSEMDINIDAALRKVPELSDDPTAAKLAGRKLPIVLSGTPDAPQFTVDMKSALMDAATSRLRDKFGFGRKENTTDDEDEDEDATQSAINSVLGGLFGDNDEDDPDGD